MNPVKITAIFATIFTLKMLKNSEKSTIIILAIQIMLSKRNIAFSANQVCLFLIMGFVNCVIFSIVVSAITEIERE